MVVATISQFIAIKLTPLNEDKHHECNESNNLPLPITQFNTITLVRAQIKKASLTTSALMPEEDMKK